MKKRILNTLISFLILSCEKEEDCQKSARCNLVPDSGFCRAYIPKYYFDNTDGKYKEFIWGGCDGVVPFQTMEECKQCECSQQEEPVRS